MLVDFKLEFGTNSSGEILQEWGNSEKLIYPRSALKPIQSLNLYKDGVAEDLNISDEYIALTTASHHSEIFHQKMVIKWLEKINLNEDELCCGPDWPWNLDDKFVAKKMFLFLSSEVGLSVTITNEGLFDDALIKPQEPSFKLNLTPFTVKMLLIS